MARAPRAWARARYDHKCDERGGQRAGQERHHHRSQRTPPAWRRVARQRGVEARLGARPTDLVVGRFRVAQPAAQAIERLARRRVDVGWAPRGHDGSSSSAFAGGSRCGREARQQLAAGVQRPLLDGVLRRADQRRRFGQRAAFDRDQHERYALLWRQLVQQRQQPRQIRACRDLVLHRRGRAVDQLFDVERACAIGRPPPHAIALALARAQVVVRGVDRDAMEVGRHVRLAAVRGQRTMQSDEDVLDQVVALGHGADQAGEARAHGVRVPPEQARKRLAVTGAGGFDQHAIIELDGTLDGEDQPRTRPATRAFHGLTPKIDHFAIIHPSKDWTLLAGRREKPVRLFRLSGL